MLDKAIAEKLIDRAPLAIIAIGVLVFIIGAAGGLPIGSPPLRIGDVAWRVGLGAMGEILTLAGLLLTATEGRLSPFSSSTVRQFGSDEELLRYMLKRMQEAKRSIYDLTWADPLESAVITDDYDREEYTRIIEDVSKRVKYREIMMFCGSKERIRKARRLIKTAGKGYQLAGYSDLPNHRPGGNLTWVHLRNCEHRCST
jgi:hypothetical protein